MKQDVLRQVPIINWKIASKQIYTKKHIINYYILIIYIGTVDVKSIFLQLLGKNCAALYEKGIKQNGVYQIDPDGKGSFKVMCDMTTSGGG